MPSDFAASQSPAPVVDAYAPWAGLFTRLAFNGFGVTIGVLAFWAAIYCIILVCWTLNKYDEHIEWMRSGIKARE
jgi:hypothetical protein